MDERELREIFLERLHVEIRLFRDTMLRMSKADIYAGSYKVEVYVNIYEILVTEAERMQEPVLRKLLYQGSGILDSFYEGWLDKDDSFYTELREHVENEMEATAVRGTDRRKEDQYGNEHDKTS